MQPSAHPASSAGGCRASQATSMCCLSPPSVVTAEACILPLPPSTTLESPALKTAKHACPEIEGASSVSRAALPLLDASAALPTTGAATPLPAPPLLAALGSCVCSPAIADEAPCPGSPPACPPEPPLPPSGDALCANARAAAAAAAAAVAPHANADGPAAATAAGAAPRASAAAAAVGRAASLALASRSCCAASSTACCSCSVDTGCSALCSCGVKELALTLTCGVWVCGVLSKRGCNIACVPLAQACMQYYVRPIGSSLQRRACAHAPVAPRLIRQQARCSPPVQWQARRPHPRHRPPRPPLKPAAHHHSVQRAQQRPPRQLPPPQPPPSPQRPQRQAAQPARPPARRLRCQRLLLWGQVPRSLPQPPLPWCAACVPPFHASSSL